MSIKIKKRNIFYRVWCKIANPILRKRKEPSFGLKEEYEKFVKENSMKEENNGD